MSGYVKASKIMDSYAIFSSCYFGVSYLSFPLHSHFNLKEVKRSIFRFLFFSSLFA